ncbi:hypothetical protein [Photobacterium damselae]|uniref:hypothetical protein n=1 Tax=Photobacterium damselae TaxID=38293 RepID=UPI001F1D4DA1|nr:hypothetical protein [Photobacterium damselae]UKA04787.1 hypothetical protein IHC89_21330 [Photobacterium damselae subsp. damselae]
MWYVCNLKTDKTVGKNKNSQYPLKPVVAHEFGKHHTRDDALIALVLAFYPENHDSSIEHLKRVAKEFLSGSMKTFAILKIKEPK